MTDPVLIRFGRRVRRERAALRLTQGSLAARVPGLTASAVSRAELAKSDLGLTSAVRIATALGVPLGCLVEGP